MTLCFWLFHKYFINPEILSKIHQHNTKTNLKPSLSFYSHWYSLKHNNATMQEQITHKKAPRFSLYSVPQVFSIQITHLPKLFWTFQNLFLSFYQCKPYFTFELQWNMLRMVCLTLMNWIGVWCAHSIRWESFLPLLYDFG